VENGALRQRGSTNMKRILIVLTSLSLIAGFVAATPSSVSAVPAFSTYGPGWGSGGWSVVVSQFGNDAGEDVDGSCAAPDFNTIQGAVDWAEEEWGLVTTIFICNGIYHEQIDATIGLTLVGEHKLKTILDGSQNVSGDGIIFHAPLGDDSISIWDMTIRNGDGDNGGALYTDGNFYCSNSVFFGNSASSDGGAVYVDSEQDASVQNCSFLNNNAGDEGGALYVTDSFASEGSIYANNQAEEQGGAVHADELNYSRLDLFHNNESVDNDGGAIYVLSGSVASVIDRSVFRQNTATERGGAVYYDEEYRLTITSSSFIGNSSTDDGGDGGAIFLKGDDSDDYLIITGGPRTPTIFQGNYSDEDGGAISVDDDNGSNGMSVTNTRFTDNVAGYSGGAIESDNEIYLYSTTFTGNRAGDAGGAVSADEATTVSRSTFTRNTAVGQGGGAISASDNLTVTSSTFTNNAADDGGAIEIDLSGTLTVEGSTFTGNQAQGDLNDPDNVCTDDGPEFCGGRGGAIFTEAFETVVSRSTFKNNSATDEGGAIVAQDDDSTVLRVRNSTFIGNQAEEAGALSSRTLDFLELRGNLFQANRAYGVDFTPNFSWAVGAVMVETNSDPYVIAGNRFISNVGWGVGALYLVDDCGGTPIFDQASMRANTWRSNRVTGGQPQIYRDVRTEGNDFC
jgi:predicted outer membrane repeat protein